MTGTFWVLAAEFLVTANLDNCGVFLQHGAIRDLVPAVAIDHMSHHGATADQRCGHCGPPWGGNCEPAIRWRRTSHLREIARASDWRCRPTAQSRRLRGRQYAG